MKINKETILKYLESFSDFASSDNSFSPFYSNIGIEVNPEAEGSGALWLHYNRASRKMWDNFLTFPLKQNCEKTSSWCVFYGSENKNVRITFTDVDTVFVGAENVDEIKIFAEVNKKLRSFWIESFNENEITVRGFSENADDRDPDETVPFYAKLKAIDGKFFCEKNEIKIKNSKDAIKNGIAYLSEDRRKTGIFDILSITDNIGIVAIDKYLLKSFIIDYNKLKEEVNKNIKDLNIKVSTFYFSYSKN